MFGYDVLHGQSLVLVLSTKRPSGFFNKATMTPVVLGVRQFISLTGIPELLQVLLGCPRQICAVTAASESQWLSPGATRIIIDRNEVGLGDTTFADLIGRRDIDYDLDFEIDALVVADNQAAL